MRDVLVQLGKRIRALREERKISQEELADRADIHRNYISQIEGGKRNVSFYYVVKIARANTMPSIPIPGGRRSIRVAMKKRANLVINLGGNQTMLPCLIVDKSQEGFRLRGNFNLRRGQLVELVVDDMNSVRCEVIWIGRAGSAQAGEAGFQTVGK